MRRIFTPTYGPSDWRRLLADPTTQWRRRKSAYELAVSWESASRSGRGLPSDVQAILDGEPTTSGAELLLALPELQVELPGGGHASQTDLWALLRRPAGVAQPGHALISVAIEAKAGESFDHIVSDWLKDAKPSSGKPTRLAHLCKTLGLDVQGVGQLRYQLFHRAVVALSMAERFGASAAVLLVQAFGGPADASSLKDFQAFGRAMGGHVEPARLAAMRTATPVPLFLGWLDSPAADEERLAAAT